MPNITVHHGDSREVLRTLPDCSIDACITDPPYALVSIGKRFGKEGAAPAKGDVYARASSGFMQCTWDTGEVAFDPAFWAEVLRVLKPGAHLAAFGGTRTYGRLQVAIEDAGFEVRDSVIELVATDERAVAFMNSLNDEQRQAFIRMLDEREGGLMAWLYGSGFPKSHDVSKGIDKALGREFTASPASGVGFMGPDGPGGYNPTKNRLTLSGDPSPEAAAWSGWGTALKPAIEPIVLARKPLIGTIAANVMAHGTGGLNIDGCRIGDGESRPTLSGGMARKANPVYGAFANTEVERIETTLGRWPANVVHDGSDEVLAAFPGNGDQSSARFFMSAKADAEDRLGSKHPTVKPVDLMRWLCTLITPPGGTVLDPFAGSGSTGLGAMVAGFDAVLIEREAAFVEDIHRRVAWARGRGGVTNELIKRSRQAPADTGLLSLLGE